MMKKLLVLVLVFVSFGAYSQAFKDVNQKLYFKNATKFGDTLFVDSASVLGSGHFLKIQDTTTSPWTVIRSEIDATDTSFFNRASNKLTPKNAGDTIEAAGLDLNGLSGSGSFLKIGDDNRVTRGVETDTSFFNRISNKIIPKNIGDTIEAAGLDLNGLSGSGSFLKIGNDNRVIRGTGIATDTSFFNRASNKLSPKNAGDSLEAAGLDLFGLSGSGNELRIGSDNRVYRAPIDTSFFNRGGSLVVLKTLTDTFQASHARINTIQTCVDSTIVGNTTGGFTGLAFTNNCSVNVITYSDTTSSGLQPKVITFGGLISGSTVTLVGGFRAASADSSVVIFDMPPFYLNGNDTLKYRESITLFIKSATEAIEVSRSDN